jgi:hypothetical protein
VQWNKKIKTPIIIFIPVALIILSAIFLFWFYTDTMADMESAATQALAIIKAPFLPVKHAPVTVKGLYLTAYSAGNPEKMKEILKLIDSTELNSIVIDIKDYSGNILYDSKVPLTKELDLKDVRIKDLPALLRLLRQHNVYSIARISVFQDPQLAEKKHEWALKSKNGNLWRDKKGLAWVDPANNNVWQYVASIAKEAARTGFDEVNFDYIRFPTDGNLQNIAFTNMEEKYTVIENFFKYVATAMADEPVYISADLFGLTTEKTDGNDMQIGQRLADAVKYFDYVCPMVYPSHYPPRYMGFSNPAEHPYEVVYQAVRSGVAQAQSKRAKIRPWIQDFNIGAVYGGDKIRAQINAADAAGADGWILWNAANRYSDEGLLLKKL